MTGRPGPLTSRPGRGRLCPRPPGDVQVGRPGREVPGGRGRSHSCKGQGSRGGEEVGLPWNVTPAARFRSGGDSLPDRGWPQGSGVPTEGQATRHREPWTSLRPPPPERHLAGGPRAFPGGGGRLGGPEVLSHLLPSQPGVSRLALVPCVLMQTDHRSARGRIPSHLLPLN